MKLEKKQQETRIKIQFFARLFGVDEDLATAVAMTESSLGMAQVSPTGAKGVFQMTSIAMQDLLNSMAKIDDDMVDIVCGIAFLRLLLKRWGTFETAIEHYCDPADRSWYVAKVIDLRRDLQQNK